MDEPNIDNNLLTVEIVWKNFSEFMLNAIKEFEEKKSKSKARK